ncbi:MAG: hypothetical protein KA354_16175 [Phycisphaerae bacterium]|nr:hypothetical protein [Phycisphaerae bacterium]
MIMSNRRLWRSGWRRAGIGLVVAAAAAVLGVAGFSRGEGDEASSAVKALKKADGLVKDKNWAEARVAYDKVRVGAKDWSSPDVRSAVEGAVACSLQLQQWDDALERAQEYIARTPGTLAEAIGERFLAGLYIRVPHHGTKQGGRLLRGQYTQGVRVSTWNKDRRAAIAHYERARELLIKLAQAPAARPADVDGPKATKSERIGVAFDLAGVLARRNEYQYGSSGWCYWWWDSGLADEEDSEAVEEADYEEPRWGWRRNPSDQKPPTGIPVGPDGKPQFIVAPREYSPRLGDGPKIRFLLEEVRQIDDSEKKNDAATALMRWAMIARTLYGPESAQGNAKEPVKKVWELADDEALTMVGGRVGVVTLPPSESPIACLRTLDEVYPQSDVRPEAHYALAMYYQTRQQFPKAVGEYEALIKLYPNHDRKADAETQIARIKRPEAILSPTGIFLPDDRAKLSFTYRNTDQIDFVAYAFDLEKYVRDRMEKTDEQWWNYRNIHWDLFSNEHFKWKSYKKGEVARWVESVPRPEGNRVAESASLSPLTKPGAYIVEARPNGPANDDGVSRALLLVTDIAIVQKNLPGGGLIWVVDARTGQPLADKAVRIYEHWSRYDDNKKKHVTHYRSSVETTDKNGAIEYKRGRTEQWSQVDAIVLGEGGRMAFSFFQNWNENDPAAHHREGGPRIYVVTDRPVYRPGSTIRYRIWCRDLQDRVYQTPHARQRTHIVVYDPKNNPCQTLDLETDENGCVSGEFTLGVEPPLGVYRIQVNGNGPGSRAVGGGFFRAEEYKKPEFEVTVKPAKTQARLGEKVKARIEARYYFGAPVAKGKVTYKVFRENYQHVYWGAAEYDWLYGKGYGRYYYPYAWFPWWGRWGCFICCEWGWPYYGPYGYGYGDDQGWRRRYETDTRKALRDLVAQGTAELKDDGSYEIEVDTAKAKEELGDRDHRYTVEAEVRDASRRTIEGSGSVIVTRQAFYAFVETNAGWYQPQNEAFIEIRTLTPDNVPVAVKGEAIVYHITYGGADHDAVQEEELKRWSAETDADGRLSFRYPIPRPGQYRVAFKTKDSWNEEVLGNAVFWAWGPTFDGRVYRFNDLEIIADKRTYKIGEVAHLLVNVAQNNSRMLFSDDASMGTLRNYRFIDIPSRTMVIDIPIGDKQVPDFFVEATLVRDGRVHTESREIFVPPVNGLLNVTVKTDRPTYKPGEKGKVEVAVTDLNGEPVCGQVTLTAFDEAVTYIQDEYGPSPKVFFHGQKRQHSPYVDSSLSETFQAQGTFDRPEQWIHNPKQQPMGWQGWWDLESLGLAYDGEAKQDRFGGSGGAAGRLAGRAKASRSLYSGSGREEAMDKSLASPAVPTSAAPMAGISGDLLSAQVSESGADFDGITDNRKPPGQGQLVEAEVRTLFADTALWMPAMSLDDHGKGTTEFTFPQSLTTWRVHGYALTQSTQVGDSTAKAVTTKNLLVRLQAPRFFVERDEVVLSANVHNYLKAAKRVSAELIVPAELFGSLGEPPPGSKPDAEGNLHLAAQAEVAAGGEHRFDWPVKVLKQGLAKITVKALTDEESDAMRMAFPVLVHGINKTVAQSGSYRVPQEGERTIKIDLPEQIDPEQTRLEVTLSPSLAGVMIDALPYLIGYPYGCVEQTMSRFYPTVLVADTLKKMGTNLEAIGKQRKQMNEGDLQNRFGRYDHCPVFDSQEMDHMVKAGLQRLYDFQRPDGGWGWWREDDSSPFQTAYVLQGLHAARQAGINVDGGCYERGVNYLQGTISHELTKPKDERRIGDLQTQAYVAYILSLENRLAKGDLKKWLDGLYKSRGDLNNYGRSLLALAMHNMKRDDEARMLLRNVLQFVERDDSNETAWVRTPQSHWWFWWNNDIETNAWALKAMVVIDPKDDLAPRLVKWLLNNRRNGYYWRSTRDTAQVIAAMTDYMAATGESSPEYALVLSFDGQPIREIILTKDNFFTFDNRLALYGLQVKPGAHTVTLAKKGPGALYYSCYLSYFTKEEDIKGAGNEIFIERQYFKLVPKTETARLPDPGAAHTPPANQPDPLDTTGRSETRAGWTRIPLKTGDAVASGDQVEVVLTITSKNVYDYLVFEDMKPAGCEPVELRSGGRWAGGLCANLELRDEKVCFFIGLLEQGEHILRYRLRAETPGSFHVLPASGHAMYAPEVKAISDEIRLGVRE